MTGYMPLNGARRFFSAVFSVRQGPENVDGLFNLILQSADRVGTLAERARSAGLLGAIINDLAPLHYLPIRFGTTSAQDVMAIFGTEEADIPFESRVQAAVALGRAGDPPLLDPRVDHGYWVTFPSSRFKAGAQSFDPSEANYDSNAVACEGAVREVELAAFQIADSRSLSKTQTIS